MVAFSRNSMNTLYYIYYAMMYVVWRVKKEEGHGVVVCIEGLFGQFYNAKFIDGLLHNLFVKY